MKLKHANPNGGIVAQNKQNYVRRFFSENDKD